MFLIYSNEGWSTHPFRDIICWKLKDLIQGFFLVLVLEQPTKSDLNRRRQVELRYPEDRKRTGSSDCVHTKRNRLRLQVLSFVLMSSRKFQTLVVWYWRWNKVTGFVQCFGLRFSSSRSLTFRCTVSHTYVSSHFLTWCRQRSVECMGTTVNLGGTKHTRPILPKLGSQCFEHLYV